MFFDNLPSIMLLPISNLHRAMYRLAQSGYAIAALFLLDGLLVFIATSTNSGIGEKRHWFNECLRIQSGGCRGLPVHE
jgi:hypothetical protein